MASALPPVVKGWEVLWGRQGLVGGAYWSGGEYVLKGDVNNVSSGTGLASGPHEGLLP